MGFRSQVHTEDLQNIWRNYYFNSIIHVGQPWIRTGRCLYLTWEGWMEHLLERNILDSLGNPLSLQIQCWWSESWSILFLLNIFLWKNWQPRKWTTLQSTAQIKIHCTCTSVRMSAGIPVDISILQSNRNSPKKWTKTITNIHALSGEKSWTSHRKDLTHNSNIGSEHHESNIMQNNSSDAQRCRLGNHRRIFWGQSFCHHGCFLWPFLSTVIGKRIWSYFD